jgi:hypothetical protein
MVQLMVQKRKCGAASLANGLMQGPELRALRASDHVFFV